MYMNNEVSFRATNDELGFRFVDNSLQPEPVFQRTPRAELIEAYDTIKRVTGSNADLKSLFEELLRDDGFKPAKRQCAPLPRDPADIEVFEVTMWDNWLGDKAVKGQPNRYVAEIKAWFTKEIDFRKLDDVDFKARVPMMTPDQLRKLATKAQQTKGRKYPISSDYAAMVNDGCEAMESGGLAGGMAYARPWGAGTLYFDRQMMMADTNAIQSGDPSATAIIWLDAETPIKLPAWSTTDAAGKPLPKGFDNATGRESKCVMQIRYARDENRFRGWISGSTS
ncbi:hypothetical protein [Novosphingobium guangzhouense]|uniref:Uncharacterized protein n=1 Tax=Novosphingobium guangzhouense TaxID=1850347 RepID=A0A2K2G394_9SPHN|nr:hypothetical protein [Novosphingobium guangzhouense]PNU05482.1 hypothetical protein A8V01_15975 [Novosphingobium guangzhouense]